MHPVIGFWPGECSSGIRLDSTYCLKDSKYIYNVEHIKGCWKCIYSNGEESCCLRYAQSTV
jgi:hypothetical protein